MSVVVSTDLQGGPATDGRGGVAQHRSPRRADHADVNDHIALLDLVRAAQLERSEGEYPALPAAALPAWRQTLPSPGDIGPSLIESGLRLRRL
jgi:hypothetical protein